MSQNLSKPLSESEINKLHEMLDSISNGQSMNLENLDGFFAALICCPELIPMRVYYTEILGVDPEEEESPFDDIDQMNLFLDLTTRHWNCMIDRIENKKFTPFLINKTEEGEFTGNDWAKGFLCGTILSEEMNKMCEMCMAYEGDSKEFFLNFVPILMLAYENDEEDPIDEENISPKMRKELLESLSLVVFNLYHYFLPLRHADFNESSESTKTRQDNKVGRNDPCPCGSGQKYKKCCLKKKLLNG